MRLFYSLVFVLVTLLPVRLLSQAHATPILAITQAIACNGDDDGSIEVTPVGGESPYLYTWSDGTVQLLQTAPGTISGLVAATYSVTVTDKTGNIKSASITLTEPLPLAAGITIDKNVSCAGEEDAMATAVGSGGAAPYQYAWSNGATTASVEDLGSGSYSVTITDDNGCTELASTVVSQPIALGAGILVDASVSCNGGNDGALSAEASGGTPPYNYAWSNGATTVGLTGLVAGNYALTVTDANGCTATNDVDVTEPTALEASIAVDQMIRCHNGTNGALSVSGKGGTLPYTYAWASGSTASKRINLNARTYTVTITDANGCTDVATIDLTDPPSLNALAVTDVNVSCNGGADGAATASASGGVGMLRYQWSNGATTASVTGLLAATYSVTVTDANGCADVASVTIDEPTAVRAFASTTANVSCFESADGTAEVSSSGGTQPHTYLWSNGAVTAELTGLAPGSYSVTVTDARGCTDVSEVSIFEPTELVASAEVTATPVCNGAATGAVSATATGGGSTYTYLWSNGATTAVQENLTAGTYSVTVSDLRGCNDTRSVTITEPTALVATVVNHTNVSCSGGADGGAAVAVTGGTGSYTYAWDNGGTNGNLLNASAGVYAVTVTDGAGCTTTETVTITEPSALTTVLTQDAEVTCNGGIGGAVTATVGGGTAPYTYAWSTGATTAGVTGLAAGTYGLTLTDANGCTRPSSITLTEPPAMSPVLTTASVSCNGASDGSASITVTGGSAPYTYLWSNDATTPTVSGLAAGTYGIIITDANGCTTTASATVEEPEVLSANATAGADAGCEGESAGAGTVQPAGGTGPYGYTWSNGATTATATGLAAGTYTITVTDAKACTATTSLTITEAEAIVPNLATESPISCNGMTDGALSASPAGGSGPYTYEWSNGSTEASIDKLAPATYTVTITDANGCTATESFTLEDPAVLAATVTVDAMVSCHGGRDGAATAVGSGGTGPYTYAWFGGLTTASIDRLFASSYAVTVTDANGCTATSRVAVPQPNAITLELESTEDPGDGTGTASVVVTGGAGDLTYAWNTSPERTTASLDGLPAGSYSVTVTDTNGCTGSGSVTVLSPPEGSTCINGYAIDSLLGGGVGETRRSELIVHDEFDGRDLPGDMDSDCFAGDDTLYHPVWVEFMGDGNAYQVALTDELAGADAPAIRKRSILMEGDCGQFTVLTCAAGESTVDTTATMLVQTSAGRRYTLLIDAIATPTNDFLIEVTRDAVSSVPATAIRELTVYPNPTRGRVTIQGITAERVDVLDAYGRRVGSPQRSGNQVDLRTLPRGVYYLRVTDDHRRVYTSRVVRQ